MPFMSSRIGCSVFASSLAILVKNSTGHLVASLRLINATGGQGNGSRHTSMGLLLLFPVPVLFFGGALYAVELRSRLVY